MTLKTIMFFRTDSISFFLLFFCTLLYFTLTTAQHGCCNINNGTIQGFLAFTNVNDLRKIDVTLSGLTPNKKMGIHIHKGSDLSNGCTKAGGHFNPDLKQHGCRTTDPFNVHYGDLGNIESNAAGQVSATLWHPISTLPGHDIGKRAIVIHENVDDCGLGGYDDSLINGHTGKPIACCLIEAISQGGSCGSGGNGAGGGTGSGGGGSGGGGVIGIGIGPIKI